AAALVLGGGDDDPGDDPRTETSAGETTETPGDAQASSIDTPLGAPLEVPAGLGQPLAAPAEWDEGGPCDGDSACAVVADDGDVVSVEAPGDGTATVRSLAAENGEEQWTLPLDGLSSPPGLARLGDLVIVSSTAGDTRTYRGIDGEGEKRWELPVPQDDQPVFPNTQMSEDYGVLLLAEVDAYLVVDLVTGIPQRGEGRVLATDRTNVYVADGDRVVARPLADAGTETWEAEGIVSAAPVGAFPAWRFGVVASDLFVTVTDSEVVALNRESAAEAWPARVPISADGKDLGRVVAVSNVGDVVVVAAERGDLGIDARSGTIVWRVMRDRLVFDPELDADTIRAVQGSPVWVGTGDHLLVGWTGAHIQLIDVTNGEVLGSVDLEPTGGRSALAIGQEGIAIIEAGGIIAAYGYESIDDPLWTTDAFPEATGLAAVDGGLVVLDPTGLHGLRA
ncbi:MAG TPA: PQQ-binding-like beta-propeller repeat protein, partial [Iamia sp.]